MQVYHYDIGTKLLSGTSEAHPNPMREGEFLIPAFATALMPPALAPNEAAKWVDDHWAIVPVVVDPGTGTAQPIDLVGYAGDVRWRLEIGGTGMVVEDMSIPIATDRDSQMKIFASRYQADRDPNFTVNWKCPDGAWRILNASAILAASNAVLLHIKKCFDTEQLVVQKIGAGEITTVPQVDAAFASM
ncbi:DUF4376 domain-containing protein [Mesorhizobium sp. 1M-11]|uniref:DUF4376 domain-containing protein n=1 Tax=Mesorhizobium sp. 1M-11 TaxID=1529006 RepID=UPI0006C7438A|nr:DUF4376 domain-containing protein [Mesorhizobium sp. 1M-11]